MTLKMLHDFEQGLDNLRSWMDSVETNLQKPLTLNALNPNEIRSYQQSILVCLTLFLKIVSNFLLIYSSQLKMTLKNIVLWLVMFLLLVIIY